MGSCRPSVASYITVRGQGRGETGRGRGGWGGARRGADAGTVGQSSAGHTPRGEARTGREALGAGELGRNITAPRVLVDSALARLTGAPAAGHPRQGLFPCALKPRSASLARSCVGWLHLSGPTPHVFLDLLKTCARLYFFSDWTKPLCVLHTP